ncbi:MAG: D-2-hydroxyacid dehydrogenase family protein [Dehalococcoidia bacterium]|nr:D-2-hydroxyacid dehydrogenase family protein [Dehalococcoidia bacterium]
MARIAVLDDYQNVARRIADWSLLRAHEVVFFRDHLEDEGAVAKRLHDFDFVIAMRERTPFPDSLLRQLPSLRLLVTTGRRNASFDTDAATKLGIVVSYTGGTSTSTADLTIGLMIAVMRHITKEDRTVREGHWQRTVGVALGGKTLGVIGLGTIGSHIAQIAQALRMHVVAWSQNLTAARAAECGARFVSKLELLQTSDVVTIHLRLSPRTRGLLGADDLALMKRTAYLINTSRGPIVDEAALVSALNDGTIAGAGLDTFDQEPLPKGHPLLTARNTVLTPHLGYVTEDSYHTYYTDAIESILSFVDGKPLRVLNPEVLDSPARRR